MKVEIDIHSDVADLLIVENLKDSISCLEKDLKRRIKGKGVGVFSTDPATDVAEIYGHLQAFKMTLSYFGVESSE